MDDLLKEILIKEFSISPEKLKEVFEKVYCNYLSNSRTEVLQTTRVEELFEDKRIVCNYNVKFLENIFELFDGNSIKGDIEGRKLISTLDLKPKDLIINWFWKK